jgi:hypothetical protein
MPTTHFELADALKEPYCAVCRLAASTARAYLEGVLRDGVNDPVVRNDWRRRGGLCARHWRTWRGLDSPPLPSAILTRDLLANYRKAGSPQELGCRACRSEEDAERRYLGQVGSLDAETTRSLLAAGPGFLCLRHVERLPRTPVREALESRLDEILAELSEFVRKSDYRHADEPRGREGDSWLRAIRVLGGDV